ncbi:MAG: DUF2442 domain-containing protein [Actinomycetaceae bacterium]|nr:DUF2442 domain-containing protein [Arcanobacterium sp.]MDD7686891.1 DUF2442 domain-containing protein [Actinomycetaceae bacterium]MDY5274018.1 DUF2442 domain-containing protein [Arcanobacterium sp.]
MFELNGIMYASEPTADMRVKAIKLLDNFTMLVTFSTGEKRVLDCVNLTAYPAFADLCDGEIWASARIDRGVLTWNDGQVDIAADKLYELSYEYNPTAV